MTLNTANKDSQALNLEQNAVGAEETGTESTDPRHFECFRNLFGGYWFIPSPSLQPPH